MPPAGIRVPYRTVPSCAACGLCRHHTVADIAEAQARPPVITRCTEPDWASWTSKGWGGARAERSIEADRWGRCVREPKPPLKHRVQA